MQITTEAVKELRDETGVSVMQCKKALEEAGGDKEKALAILAKKSGDIAKKKGDRTFGAGVVASYIHNTKDIGAMIVLSCETDFVAKTDEFKHLAREVAMQVAAMDPNDVETLLKMDYIRDGSQTIESMVKEAIHKTGENIVIKKFERFAL